MSDLIDREKLKKAVCAECVKFGDCIVNKESCLLMHTIDAQPTVDAAKHGKWIDKAVMERTPFARNWYCSECKLETHFCGNFCPNCGAHMDLSIKSTGCDGANLTKEVSTDESEDDG